MYAELRAWRDAYRTCMVPKQVPGPALRWSARAPAPCCCTCLQPTRAGAGPSGTAGTEAVVLHRAGLSRGPPGLPAAWNAMRACSPGARRQRPALRRCGTTRCWACGCTACGATTRRRCCPSGRWTAWTPWTLPGRWTCTRPSGTTPCTRPAATRRAPWAARLGCSGAASPLNVPVRVGCPEVCSGIISTCGGQPRVRAGRARHRPAAADVQEPRGAELGRGGALAGAPGRTLQQGQAEPPARDHRPGDPGRAPLPGCRLLALRNAAAAGRLLSQPCGAQISSLSASRSGVPGGRSGRPGSHAGRNG